MRPNPSFLAVVGALSAALLPACLGPPPEPTPTPSESAPPNACTPFPAPSVEPSELLRGANALAYVLGLVCDHSGPQPLERARVPGTPAHGAGRAFLTDALEDAGFDVTVQSFSGSGYEAIIQDDPNAAAYRYYKGTDYCDPADLPRMRGLQFANILATGGTVGGPIFLLMAHWDSKRFADSGEQAVLGANDGASGVGLLLELARVIEPADTRLEIRIFLTDGEDGFEDCHPLAGSTYFAENLPEADRQRLRAILLLDMVGDADSAFYKGCGSDAALADRIWAAADRLDVPQFKAQAGCGVVDDHTPFEERGMESVDVIPTPFPPYWHTTRDTPDQLSADFLGDVGRVLLEVIPELEPGPVPVIGR